MADTTKVPSIGKREWVRIELAPKDGFPLWVRGNNYGDKSRGQHCCWAYWTGSGWYEAGSETPSELLYLTDYMAERP